MAKTSKEEIEMMFRLMEYDNLTDSQHDLVLSFEEQFNRKGTLSERQCEILEEILDKAASKTEWSRW